MMTCNRTLTIVFLSMAIMNGCSKSYDLGDKAADSVAVDTVNPTWANGIGTLITTKCVSCHTPASQRSKFVPGNTPSTLDGMNVESFFADAAKASLVAKRALDDTTTPMPPKFATQLTADEKAALTTWLATKTVNVSSLCGASGSSSWTFADASKVISADCGGCHTGGSQVAFDSVAKVKTYRATMLQYLNAGTMPPSSSTYKSTGNGALLFGWLCFGSDIL